MNKSSSCGCLSTSSVQIIPQKDDEKSDLIRKRSSSSDDDVTPTCDFCGILNFSFPVENIIEENPINTIFDCMDQENKTAMDVLKTEGADAAVKYMMTGKDGKPRDYAEMRQVYG